MPHGREKVNSHPDDLMRWKSTWRKLGEVLLEVALGWVRVDEHRRRPVPRGRQQLEDVFMRRDDGL